MKIFLGFPFDTYYFIQVPITAVNPKGNKNALVKHVMLIPVVPYLLLEV